MTRSAEVEKKSPMCSGTSLSSPSAKSSPTATTKSPMAAAANPLRYHDGSPFIKEYDEEESQRGEDGSNHQLPGIAWIDVVQAAENMALGVARIVGHHPRKYGAQPLVQLGGVVHAHEQEEGGEDGPADETQFSRALARLQAIPFPA